MTLEEGSTNVCSRDIDCDLLIKYNPGGLKLCNHGKCAPNSAVALEEAGANVFSRDIDYSFLIKHNPGDLKLCDHGKCICLGGKTSPPASA
ncbi:hypothetical protein ACFXTN_030757 [Malus domestica]